MVRVGEGFQTFQKFLQLLIGALDNFILLDLGFSSLEMMISSLPLNAVQRERNEVLILQFQVLFLFFLLLVILPVQEGVGAVECQR